MTSKESITEAARLRNKAYGSDCQLNKRRGLYQFATPDYNLEGEVIRKLPLPDTKGKRLLDAGCGNGALLLSLTRRFPEIKLIGLDLSSGVFAWAATEAKQHKLTIDFRVGDVQNLPFGPGSFDYVTAVHMIYHVPDIARGLAELARVLTKNGTLVLTANSHGSLPRMRMFKREAAELMGTELYRQTDDRFNIEGGAEFLQQHFSTVKLETYPSTIRLQDPEPYVQYFDSTRSFWKPSPDDRVWQRALAMIRETIQVEIEQAGEFTDEKTFGIFTAEK